MNKNLNAFIILVVIAALPWFCAAALNGKYKQKRSAIENARSDAEMVSELASYSLTELEKTLAEAGPQARALELWSPHFLAADERISLNRIQSDIRRIAAARNNPEKRVELSFGNRSASGRQMVDDVELTTAGLEVMARHNDLTRLFNFLGSIQGKYPQARIGKVSLGKNEAAADLPEIKFSLVFADIKTTGDFIKVAEIQEFIDETRRLIQIGGGV